MLHKKRSNNSSGFVLKQNKKHTNCLTKWVSYSGHVHIHGFITDQETALQELYGNTDNIRRFNNCMNNMAIRMATVFASLKELPNVWYRSAKESDESEPTASRELVPTKLADAVYEMVSKYKSTIPNFP
ncbi:transport Sec1a protein [Medicago truncatula]|uniref:Transport Sec1a protein n=1 Tax=Medicago truncatula TaxID=3880 RepID=G7JLJ1_MEDTR|nr:transport Sec1a protein [Medicago truncatula]